jgi:predicted DNA-binding protein (UPF0278 family)
MSVGLAVTKEEIDSRAGDIARSFQRAFDDVAVLKGFLDATPDADLIALGYEPEEVAVLKSGWNTLAELGTIWIGAAPLPTAKDFRVFVRPLWGVGAF